MFVLHIDIKVAGGKQEVLAQTWRGTFYPAVSAQPGFLRAELLQPVEDAAEYCIVLAFDQQSSQQSWVATDLHQQVWPQIAVHCEDFTVRPYNTI